MKKSLFFLVFILSCIILSLAAARAVEPGCSITLNEIYPNPPGTDTGNEWVEVYNCSDTPMNVDGWYLKDKAGGKYPLVGSIQSKAFLVVYPTFSLNQTDETVTLYNATNTIIDSMAYSSSTESLSTSRFHDGTGNWVENTQLSPNASNVVLEPDPFAEAHEISITELRSEPSSSKIYKITGISSAAIGELYPDKLYIQQNNGEGILVKLPTNVKVERGRNLRICGTKTTYYNEPMFKVEDSLCLDSAQGSQVKPRNISEANDLDNFAGSLVLLEGIIQKVSGETVWLDSQEQIKVQIPAEFKITRTKGDQLSITGILIVQKGSESTTFRIRPRTKADIKVTAIEDLERQESVKGNKIIKTPQKPLPPLNIPKYQPSNDLKFKKVAIKTETNPKEELKVLSFTSISTSLYGIIALCVKRTP